MVGCSAPFYKLPSAQALKGSRAWLPADFPIVPTAAALYKGQRAPFLRGPSCAQLANPENRGPGCMARRPNCSMQVRCRRAVTELR